ncbi:MAG: hypothetical protein NDI94_03690 [Candidatus Woesearchaeota archaeon]|nr:hypothetical protein [Candidatus Woesearchaeota archaeon]
MIAQNVFISLIILVLSLVLLWKKNHPFVFMLMGIGLQFIAVPTIIIVNIGLVLFIFLIFYATSHLSVHKKDHHMESSWKIMIFNLVLNLMFFSVIIYFTALENIYFAILLALMISSFYNGHSVGVVPSIFAIILIDIFKFDVSLFLKIGDYIIPYGLTVIISIGCGLLLGLLFAYLARKHLEKLSFVGAVVAYFSALALGGNGFVSVFIFGLMLSNVFRKHSLNLFPEIINSGMCLLVGYMGHFFKINLLSLGLFFLMMMFRFLAVESVMHHKGLKENVMRTLSNNSSYAIGIMMLLSYNLLTGRLIYGYFSSVIFTVMTAFAFCSGLISYLKKENHV